MASFGWEGLKVRNLFPGWLVELLRCKLSPRQVKALTRQVISGFYLLTWCCFGRIILMPWEALPFGEYVVWCHSACSREHTLQSCNLCALHRSRAYRTFPSEATKFMQYMLKIWQYFTVKITFLTGQSRSWTFPSGPHSTRFRSSKSCSNCRAWR